MSDDAFLCARCARHMRTCCQTSEIHVTLGDIERISRHAGRDDFTEFRVPGDADYLDQDDDPAWRDNVIRPDSSRRVLKRKPGGDCTFLGPSGCTLPLETRPLVCRIYPFDFNQDGIRTELSSGCPMQLLRPGLGLIDELQMNVSDARRWHAQLYDEILWTGDREAQD